MTSTPASSVSCLTFCTATLPDVSDELDLEIAGLLAAVAGTERVHPQIVGPRMECPVDRAVVSREQALGRNRRLLDAGT